MEIIKKIIERAYLGLKTYAKNEAKISGIYAFLTGKGIDEDQFFNTLDNKDIEVIKYITRQYDALSIDMKDPQISGQIDKLKRKIFVDNDKKYLFVLCGPTSVGKDVVFLYVQRDLYLQTGYKYVNWMKYTTKKGKGNLEKRPDGSKYNPTLRCFFLSPNAFHDNSDIVMKYSIYDCDYGFSKNDINLYSKDEKILACRYGRFEQITEFTNQIRNSYQREVISILLVAPEKDLRNRLELREYLDPEEIEKRGRALSEQAKYLEANKKRLMEQFDLVVENGNSKSLEDTVHVISKYIFSKVFIT